MVSPHPHPHRRGARPARVLPGSGNAGRQPVRFVPAPHPLGRDARSFAGSWLIWSCALCQYGATAGIRDLPDVSPQPAALVPRSVSNATLPLRCGIGERVDCLGGEGIVDGVVAADAPCPVRVFPCADRGGTDGGVCTCGGFDAASSRQANSTLTILENVWRQTQMVEATDSYQGSARRLPAACFLQRFFSFLPRLMRRQDHEPQRGNFQIVDSELQAEATGGRERHIDL